MLTQNSPHSSYTRGEDIWCISRWHVQDLLPKLRTLYCFCCRTCTQPALCLLIIMVALWPLNQHFIAMYISLSCITRAAILLLRSVGWPWLTNVPRAVQFNSITIFSREYFIFDQRLGITHWVFLVWNGTHVIAYVDSCKFDFSWMFRCRFFFCFLGVARVFPHFVYL